MIVNGVETEIKFNKIKIFCHVTKILKSPSELYRPSDSSVLEKLAPTFVNKECRVVGATDPYGRILDFLDQSRYFLFQIAPQLHSRG
jgi:hypothetical protein